MEEAFYTKLVEAFRSYMLVGGMGAYQVCLAPERHQLYYWQNMNKGDSPEGKRIDIVTLYAISALFVTPP